MDLAQAVPAVPEGAPSWVYVVAVAAAVIVAGITGAPSIIEKWRAPKQSTKDDKAEPAAALVQTQPHPPVLAAAASAETDTLRSMIADLQQRLNRSEAREDELQERVVTLTGELATARAEISSLRSQVQILTMDRRSG